MLKYFALEVLFLGLAIAFTKWRKYALSFFAVGAMVLMPAAIAGGYAMVAVENRMVPEIVFGYERAEKEHICIVDRGNERYFFSNGESAPRPEDKSLAVSEKLAFLFAGAPVFFAGYYMSRGITRRCAPEIYKILVRTGPED
jgi:hypothetical protein